MPEHLRKISYNRTIKNIDENANPKPKPNVVNINTTTSDESNMFKKWCTIL